MGFIFRPLKHNGMVHRVLLISLTLVLNSTMASAQSRTDEAPPETASSSSAGQVLYKGLVGNLLEAVPLETQDRVQLQRLSSMLSSPLSARSLAVALGIASPPLMVVGLIWGLWSANQINPTGAVAARAQGRPQPNTQHVPVSVGPIADPITTRELASLNPLSVSHGATSERESAQQLASSPQESVDAFARATRLVDAGALAQVMGAGANNDRLVPCDDCFMPMLYPRAAPDVR
jgi:hypothetical protein